MKNRAMTQGFHATLKPYSVSSFTEGSVRFCPPGYRLAVIRFKSTTDKDTKVVTPGKSAMCCPVPIIADVLVEPEVLRDAVLDGLVTLQNAIVRKAIDRWFDENANVVLSEIYIDPWSLTAEGIAKYHAIESVGGKLSEELIGSWFDSFLMEKLEIKLASLPAATDEMIAKAVKQHRELLKKLASPKAVMSEGLAKQLIKVVGFSETQDMVKDSLLRKLGGYIVKEEEMLMSIA